MDDHKNIITFSLKTLLVKPNGTKPGRRKKKKKCSISILVFSPSCRHDHDFFNSSIGRSLNLCIPMSYLTFSMWSKVTIYYIIAWPNLLNINFTFFQELMGIEEFRRDMLSFVTSYELSFNLCNTSSIIFI